MEVDKLQLSLDDIISTSQPSRPKMTSNRGGRRPSRIEARLSYEHIVQPHVSFFNYFF